MSKIDAMIGGLLGLGLGDAATWPMGGLAQKEARTKANQHFEVTKKPSWLHAALTSWTVAHLDSMLYRPRGLEYMEDLSLRAHLLIAPQNGSALRGNAPAAKNILKQTWKNLKQGDDPRLAGETEPRADLVASMLPWAFATENSAEQVIEAVIQSGLLLSRHPRTLGAMAFYVGAARHLLTQGDADSTDIFAAGKEFFDLGFTFLRDSGCGTLSESLDDAESILNVECAIAQTQDWSTLLPTNGIDIRHCPEKVLGLAMAFVEINPNQAHAALKSIAEQGGACDVIAPMAFSLFGLRYGKAHLPLALVKQLRSGLLLERRVRALFGKRPPRAEPWVYLELLLSDWLEKGLAEDLLVIDEEDASALDPKELVSEQLALL